MEKRSRGPIRPRKPDSAKKHCHMMVAPGAENVSLGASLSLAASRAYLAQETRALGV